MPSILKNSRLRLYLFAVGALTLLTLTLRTIALLTSLDVKIGYFEGGALNVLLYIIEGCSLLTCFALPFLVKAKECPVASTKSTSLTGRLATSLCAITFVALAVALYLMRNSLAAPAPLAIIGAVLLLLAALYFLPIPTASSPLLGYAVIFSSLLALSVTYFDRYTQMNAPIKLSVHISLLSIMLFMLYDIRVLLDTQKPRARIVFGAITFFLCTSLGGSNLIAFAAGVYDNSLYFFPSLAAVGFAVYTAWQLLREPASEEPLEKAEQTEEEIPAE